jgi:hypothetical protein
MEMKRAVIMRLLRYTGLRLALILLVALSLSVGLIAIRKVPHSSYSPAPTGNATCDYTFTMLESNCYGHLLLPSCCAWIKVSFGYYPSCYCLFAELNVTTMYYLIGRCKADVPPTVSACLSSKPAFINFLLIFSNQLLQQIFRIFFDLFIFSNQLLQFF